LFLLSSASVARRRFFVTSFDSGSAVLSGEEAQHLVRVLRVERGERFELSDNRSVHLAEVADVGPRWVRFALLEPLPVEEPPVRVTLFACLIKFDRFEWMVEKATELGVEAILPVESERCESGLLKAADKRAERWRRIARESSEQSRRARLPEILPAGRLDRVSVTGFDSRFFLDENPGPAPLAKSLPPSRAASDRAAILIGPEGGWTAPERQRLSELWTPVSLGKQILRAEPAAIAALAVVMNGWG
jgi:16S rRNA (uracil1498-N3)-methyltransferase